MGSLGKGFLRKVGGYSAEIEETKKTFISGVTPANQTKERPVHELFPGRKPGTNVRCESRLFPQGKNARVHKNGRIHELFVLALSLVWLPGRLLTIASGKGAESLQKFQQNLRKTFCNDPFPNKTP